MGGRVESLVFGRGERTGGCVFVMLLSSDLLLSVTHFAHNQPPGEKAVINLIALLAGCDFYV